ncbi:hypothetical protein G9A89_010606 [Geosiphon pyriformis]|nr:hypothetical protein G9A89_010606 [Geosiphon pyriformis]
MANKFFLFQLLILSTLLIVESIPQQTVPSETGSQQIVVDTIENGEYENRFSCEGFYNVPNCNSCQRQLYTSPTIANFKTCDYDGTQIINQDFNETRLDEFCGQRCDEGGVRNLITLIQQDCDYELTKAIEYLHNKNCTAERKNELTPDIELGFEAGEVVRNAYLALRTRRSYCFKDPNLGYCSLDIYAQTKDYVHTITAGKTVESNLNLSPLESRIIFDRNITIPNITTPANITKTYEVPLNEIIFCSACYRSIVSVWQEFGASFPFENPLAEALYKTDADTLEAVVTATCGAGRQLYD